MSRGAATILAATVFSAACSPSTPQKSFSSDMGVSASDRWENVETLRSFSWEGLSVEELRLESRGLARRAFLLLPRRAAPASAVVFHPGPLSSAEEALGIVEGRRMGPGAILLAHRGFVVLVAAELDGASPELGRVFPSTPAVSGFLRDLNFLRGRREVSAGHVGAAGWGLGGSCALLAAAADERVPAVYASGAAGQNAPQASYLDAWGGWAGVLGLMAPRPVFLEATEGDPVWPAAAVRELTVSAAAAFAGRPDALQAAVYPGGYRYLGTTAPDWFERWINNRP